MFKRAAGYDYEEVKEEYQNGELTKKVVTKKHIPGDITAQIFWLKNRRPEYWGEVMLLFLTKLMMCRRIIHDICA